MKTRQDFINLLIGFYGQKNNLRFKKQSMSSSATQVGAKPPKESPIFSEEMGLEEMMRVMDVATALRREQELVEREFNLDQIKQALKEKLSKTAELTSEELTDEQIEAAVSWYYDNLHEFKEPPRSFSWYLAHIYVRRRLILQVTIPILIAASVVWATWFAPFAPFSTANKLARKLNATQTAIDAEIRHLNSISQSPQLDKNLEQLALESSVLLENQDFDELTRLQNRVERLRATAELEYTITIVNKSGERSGFTRFFDDDFEDDVEKVLSGYYVIVEARTKGGRTLRQRIRNGETDQVTSVLKWAEKVPKATYERLMQDKKADGILNETTFAIKKRGKLNVDTVITGANDSPIERTIQITQW